MKHHVYIDIDVYRYATTQNIRDSGLSLIFDNLRKHYIRLQRNA